MLIIAILSQTACVTKTGKKYHAKDWVYLSNSSIVINLVNAIAKGYRACQNCMSENTTKITSEDTLKIVKKELKNKGTDPR